MKEDFAISLGGVNEAGAKSKGTLEYLGDGRATSSTRPIVLDGLGGSIKGSNAGELSLSGVSALGTGAMTLNLDAAQGTVNYLENIDEKGAVLSVDKSGAGKWVLQGARSFSGDINVSGGTLEIRDVSEKYEYFRFTVKRVAGGGDYFNAVEFALYDENGVQQLVNPVRVEPQRSSNTWVWCDIDYRSLNPGEVAYSRPGWHRSMWYSPSDFRDMKVMFDRIAGRDQASSQIYYGGTGAAGAAASIAPDKPETWLTIVMRLPASANPVAAYDMMCSSDYGRQWRASSFVMEGSRDGIFWRKLHEVSYGVGVIGEGDKSNGAYQWMSDGSSTASSVASPAVRPGCGWPLAAPPGAGSSPENFGKVTVAAGATLKGDGECTISSLRIDAANGAGTIDGFKFAESGTLEIVNYAKT
jgi:autotransporter-associated beta strand protein